MSRAVVLALALAAGLAGAARAASAVAGGDLTVSPEVLERGLLRGPDRITVEATMPPGTWAVIRIVGPEQRVRLRRRRHLAGILWIPGAERSFDAIPAVFLVRGWPRAPAEEDLGPSGLGWEAVVERLLAGSVGPQDHRDVHDLVAAKRQAGLYDVQGASDKLADGRAVLEIDLPRHAPPGDYRVTLHLLRADGVTAAGERHVVLRRSESVAAVTRLASSRPLLYGLGAVLLAVAIGLLAGRLMGLRSRVP